ncbi:TIM-barrel domain-containing protein [Thermosipho atlanticus]|uniref:Alpha-glucosidase n=1 Tax=Thermosipho atlanticus DSM 15807 TaxID=1123380 RepID=A0A1M5R953_9BACT|nr:TIM-barrel domain-containing protein [Thermosipho atlanticus]SHH22698.1 alpha-glucosidase [Thermosipho atlanticus DSM 15807]
MIYKLKYGIPDVGSEAIINEKKVINLSPNEKGLYKVEGLFEDLQIIKNDESEELIVIRKVLEGKVFGFGDKVGPFNRWGKKYIFWNTDNYTHHPGADPLYKSFPFNIFINDNQKYGIFTDYPGYLEIDLGSEGKSEIVFKIRGSGFNQYVIVGNSVRDILSQYLYLTGKNIAFPKWAFGYQQSRWSYFSDKEVLEVAKKFREKKIPCDVIYLDIDYMDDYKIFTWNERNFSNYKNMLRELHNNGFKISAILDPGVKVEKGYKIFEEGKDKYFLKDIDGKDFEGAVWPGRVRFPDFRDRKVRKWWGQKVKQLREEGIDGFWNDMNELSIFATEKDIEEMKSIIKKMKLEDGINIAIKAGMIGEIGRRVKVENIIHLDGIKHYKIKNIYGFNMIRASYEGFEKKERKMIITRSAYSGVQRYGGVWTGDNHSWWEHIQLEISRIMSLGLVGVFYNGCDVGGFGGDVNAELLVRFMQFGSFIPMFRNHSAIGTRRQEPWCFGEKYEKIMKKTIEYRYMLLPYIYSEYMIGVFKNIPLVTPLFFHFEKDKMTFDVDDQFMLGRSVIVAPIYKPGQRSRLVYLPKRSLDLNKRVFLNKGWHEVEAPLEVIPHFLVDGRILPIQEPMNYVDERESDFTVIVSAYNNKAIGYYYEDDGKTENYKKGMYNLYKITYDKGKIEVLKIRENYIHMKKVWNFRIYTKEGLKEISLKI